MLEPLLITPPSPVITLLEAKAQARVEHNDDDAYLESLVLAATGYFDGYYGILGRCIGIQTWQQKFDMSESAVGEIALCFQDINEIAGVTVAGTALAVGDYTLKFKNDCFAVVFTTPQTGVILVDMVCGFATIPPSLKHCILFLISTWYNNREAIEFVTGASARELPFNIKALYSPFKTNLVA